MRKRLLIFRVGHLGDTVVALPALWSIRRAFPDAHLALLTNYDKQNPGFPSPQSVLPPTGMIDEWLTYPTGVSRARQAASMTRLALTLKAKNFETLVYLMPRMRSTQQIDRDVRFFRACGITDMMCVLYFRENKLGLTIKPPIEPVVPEFEFLLDCVRSEGITTDAAACDLAITKDERMSADRWFSENAGDIGARILIAVAPGSKWASKVWSEDRYFSIVDKLIRESNCFPIVFGGDDDREKGERLVARWGTGLNSAGHLSVRGSAALLLRCRLYLGNDTGTMHLAAAVGVRCVAVFAAIDRPGRWDPFGNGHSLFRTTVECEGCHTPDCFNHHKCLEMIDEGRVLEACLNTLK